MKKRISVSKVGAKKTAKGELLWQELSKTMVDMFEDRLDAMHRAGNPHLEFIVDEMGIAMGRENKPIDAKLDDMGKMLNRIAVAHAIATKELAKMRFTYNVLKEVCKR